MFLCICICLFVCAYFYPLRVANRLRSIPIFEESTIKHGDQVIELFEFYEIEDPEHLFGGGKCLLTYLCPMQVYNSLPAFIYLYLRID